MSLVYASDVDEDKFFDKDPLAFIYYAGPQRVPEWYRIKRGRIGASSLWRWMSVSKAAKTEGKPLKERLDYEKELMFERQFNTSFEVFVSSAMQDGIDYEDFARREYERITKQVCGEAGCYYNKFMAVSPDRFVYSKEETELVPKNAIGLIEVKILKDNSFTEVLASGVPDKHWKQMQGQLRASGLPWNDYVAVNLNAKKVAIIRVHPDKEFHDYLDLSIQENLVTTEFDQDVIFDIQQPIPERAELGAHIDFSDSNVGEITW